MLRSFVLVFLLMTSALSAAPIPFARDRKPRPLDPTTLVGEWVVHWGSIRCVVVLAADGEYACRWGTSRYVGRWWIDDLGRLCIRESSSPGDFHAWNTYAIRLSSGAREGQVEVGSSRVAVRLEKAPISPEPPATDLFGERARVNRAR